MLRAYTFASSTSSAITLPISWSGSSYLRRAYTCHTCVSFSASRLLCVLVIVLFMPKLPRCALSQCPPQSILLSSRRDPTRCRYAPLARLVLATSVCEYHP